MRSIPARQGIYLTPTSLLDPLGRLKLVIFTSFVPTSSSLPLHGPTRCVLRPLQPPFFSVVVSALVPCCREAIFISIHRVRHSSTLPISKPCGERCGCEGCGPFVLSSKDSCIDTINTFRSQLISFIRVWASSVGEARGLRFHLPR